MFERFGERGFELLFTNHAEAILRHDFPELIGELETALRAISLPIAEIIGGGGGEAKITQRLRHSLADLGWPKHNFQLTKTVDGIAKESISHEIDHVRQHKNGRIALEIEWNNKDPFFDRDLENFKRLHAKGAISAGGIITRGSQMQNEMLGRVLTFGQTQNITSYEALLKLDLMPTRTQRQHIDGHIAAGRNFAEAWARKFVADKFGMATTHWSKLMDRVARGVGNPCPLILIGLPPSIIDMNFAE